MVNKISDTIHLFPTNTFKRVRNSDLVSEAMHRADWGKESLNWKKLE